MPHDVEQGILAIRHRLTSFHQCDPAGVLKFAGKGSQSCEACACFYAKTAPENATNTTHLSIAAGEGPVARNPETSTSSSELDPTLTSDGEVGCIFNLDSGTYCRRDWIDPEPAVPTEPAITPAPMQKDIDYFQAQQQTTITTSYVIKNNKYALDCFSHYRSVGTFRPLYIYKPLTLHRPLSACSHHTRYVNINTIRMSVLLTRWS